MRKEDFLHKLEDLLYFVPDSERNDILYDYDEHISRAVKGGMDEHDVIEALGAPEEIARQYKVKKYIDKAEKTGSAASVLRAVLATLGLGLFNVIFILGPFVAVLGMLVAAGAVAVAIMVSGAAFIVGGMFPHLISMIDFHAISVDIQGNVTAAMLFGGVGTMCLGGLVGMAAASVAKVFFKVTIKYLRLNINIIRSAK